MSNHRRHYRRDRTKEQAILREWYKPTKGGEEARRLLYGDHEAYFDS